jgi:Rps23 Pro-64 3,4-dihydroxylase Tpa1-like proline 4-hydroxylase
VTEAPLRGFFESLTGMPLGPSDDFGCHEFRVGDFLLAHDDANRNRRVALVMYLTPAWRPDFGGALSMTAADGSVDRVEAAFNSMVVFDTLAGSSHHIERIEDSAGDQARRTFGGWFPNPT